MGMEHVLLGADHRPTEVDPASAMRIGRVACNSGSGLPTTAVQAKNEVGDRAAQPHAQFQGQAMRVTALSLATDPLTKQARHHRQATEGSQAERSTREGKTTRPHGAWDTTLTKPQALSCHRRDRYTPERQWPRLPTRRMHLHVRIRHRTRYTNPHTPMLATRPTQSTPPTGIDLLAMAGPSGSSQWKTIQATSRHKATTVNSPMMMHEATATKGCN